ncbi:putative RNA-directed DNA polymerase from transposon X-element, partial [Araneus ventricosus]
NLPIPSSPSVSPVIAETLASPDLTDFTLVKSRKKLKKDSPNKTSNTIATAEKISKFYTTSHREVRNPVPAKDNISTRQSVLKPLATPKTTSVDTELLPMAVLPPLEKALLQSRESDADAEMSSSSLSEEDALEYDMSEDLEDSLAGTSPPPSSKPQKADKYKNSLAKNGSCAIKPQPTNNLSSTRKVYNTPFTFEELKIALDKSRPTSPGPDKIHYTMIKNLSENSMRTLLLLYNRIWLEECFPVAWREAVVIPIPKPGKDPQVPNNYRPIALTSCLCKLMERMVNSRLVHCLEESGLLSKFQSGFRHGRVTIDIVLQLETVIRDAYVTKKHLVSVFVDMDKAYDRTWRYGILKDMYNMGF